MDSQENKQFEQEINQTGTEIPVEVTSTSDTTKKERFNIAKKWWFWVALGVLTVILIAMFSGTETSDDQGQGSANEDYSNSQNNNSKNSSDSNDGNNDNATKPSTKPNLGDCNIVISGCRLAEDYEGKPVVIVKYSFTNYSDDPTSFTTAVMTGVYQNGIGLNESLFVEDSANYSTDNHYKEVKKGITLEVEVAYELNDTTTPIEVEVEQWLGFSDKKVTKTFNIN